MTPLRRSVCWLLLVVLVSVVAFIAAAPAEHPMPALVTTPSTTPAVIYNAEEAP